MVSINPFLNSFFQVFENGNTENLSIEFDNLRAKLGVASVHDSTKAPFPLRIEDATSRPREP